LILEDRIGKRITRARNSILDLEDLVKLEAKINKIISELEDKVRIYPVCGSCKISRKAIAPGFTRINENCAVCQL